MNTSLKITGSHLAAYYAPFTQMAEAREAQLGRPADNCPTAADMRNLLIAFQHLSTLTDPPTIGEANKLMKAVAEVSDKWVDPESDAIGIQIHAQLEALIDDLVQLIGANLPETAESLQSWNSLRRLQQAMRRTLYLRQRIRPRLLAGLIGKWQDLQVARAFRK